jgi:hypothetical protein
MGGGQPVCRRCGAAITLTAVQARRAEGLAYARAWRIRNQPIFDAMYAADREAGGER